VTFPTFDGFRIVSELGSGTMSTVYKAMQEPLGRVVALKVLKGTISPSSPFAAQLEREAQILSDLAQSNITVLHGFVKTEAEMYLILEHVEGFSLADVLAKAPTLSADVAASIGAEVARGLAHAHERGIVHRDIKPANVLLSLRGDVKIADFGIAQRVKTPEGEAARARLPSADEPITKLGDAAAFGTPAYMSPEQILGEVVDARSDIFSLGVVLYQMLSGTRPFEITRRPRSASGAILPSRCIAAPPRCRVPSSAW
jgi:eukaryotic-like serine/threonine-protein kinase